MAVRQIELIGTPGEYYITDPALYNVKILQVVRSGTPYHRTFNETAGNLQFIYSSPNGGIYFDESNPFNGPADPSQFDWTGTERIKVIYKT